MTKRVDVLTYVPGQDDPAKIAIEAVGQENIDQISVFNNRILVATAPHPEKTASGLFFTDKTIEEQRYQEKIGVVLALGETAFQHDEDFFWGDPPKIGDLIFYRVTDSMEIAVNGVSCRFVKDSNVIGKVSRLDIIW